MTTFITDVGRLISSEKYMGWLFEGFGKTILISVFAALLGLILGTIVAMVGVAGDTPWMKVPKALCKVYVTIIRGTPMALQLFIMAFVVFEIKGFPEEIIAIIAFGINSGAYVSENIRAGIMSVDKGQTEAGRALGLTGKTTMIKIVIPQAIKNVIPAIGNELIALIKETSIVSLIGIFDLTQAAKVIGAGKNLASYFVSMSAAACFYLAIVYLLTFAIKKIEKRLRSGDKR